MNKRVNGFVVCVRNERYEVSLERRKIYQVISDTSAERHKLFKVIDESEEEYLYPQGFFLPIELPKASEKTVLAVEAAGLKSLHETLSSLGPAPSAEDIETDRLELSHKFPRPDIA